MPYLVASILAVSSAMIIMLTRYEADDSTFKAEIERIESMFSLIDGFVNVYIESGESVTTVNFQVLSDDEFLYESINVFPNTVTGENVDTLIGFRNSDIRWQIVPSSEVTNITLDLNSYILFMNFTNESALMSKNRFSESFTGREFCENNLFGTFRGDFVSFNSTTKEIDSSGTGDDGILACIVHK